MAILVSDRLQSKENYHRQRGTLDDKRVNLKNDIVIVNVYAPNNKVTNIHASKTDRLEKRNK